MSKLNEKFQEIELIRQEIEAGLLLRSYQLILDSCAKN
jgi:hypothetical protein